MIRAGCVRGKQEHGTMEMWEYTDTLTDLRKRSISDFVFYNCGMEQRKPGQSYGPKRRDYHFIHFVLKGAGVLEIGGGSYPVAANQLFIVPAGEVSTYQASECDPWKYCWIGFLGIESDQALRSLMQCSPAKYVLGCEDASRYERMIETILRMPGKGIARYLRSNGLMYELIGTLFEELGADDPASFGMSAPFLAKQYMELHYHDALRISDVAAEVGVHANYLTAVFQDAYGTSPKQYLSKLRLRKAQELLINTEDPIYIVANSVGFTDALAFSKFFRRAVGQSPSDYRAEKGNMYGG